jgi:hypothetical protein
MMEQDVVVAWVEEGDGHWLSASLPNGDSTAGVALKLGPFPEPIPMETLRPGPLASLKRSVVEKWREVNANSHVVVMDMIREAVAAGGSVKIDFGDPE